MLRNAALVVLLGFTWGVNWPMARLALEEVPPWTFRTVGISCAAVLLFVAIRAFGMSARLPRRDWLRIAVVGLLAVAAFNLLSAFAQLSASTARTTVLAYTMPLWAVLLARPLLGEPFDRRRLVGLALGGAGLVVLGLPLIEAGQFSPGLLYAVAAAFFWAAGNVLLKRFPIAAPPLVVTAWQLAFAVVPMAIGTLLFEGVPDRLPALSSTWAGLAYNAVIGQAVSTTLWVTILSRMPAGIAAISSLIVPGIGVVAASLILGEHPTAFDWLGLVLIVAASATVLLRPRAGGSPPATFPLRPGAIVGEPNRSAARSPDP